MKHILSKADAAVFLVIVALAIAGLVLMSGSDGAQAALIRLDGRIVREVKLSENQEFWVDSVRFEVSRGAIRFAESDCPGQECVHAGYLNRPGSSMACLPGRVSVTILGQSGVDAVAE